MLIYLVLGITYGFAAGIMPGPFTTYLVSRTLEVGWKRTLPAAFAPLISDGPIVLLVLVILSRVPPRFEQALRLAGGVFLLYLAVGAFKAWQNFDAHKVQDNRSHRESILRASLVNLLNPNPYLSWSLVLGPILLRGWRETPAHGIALLAGFYATMVMTLIGIILLFHAARTIGPRVNRLLIGLSAMGLAGFAVYQFWLGATLG
jgi:threonine/homoserine/homoserine lactone efflux protein